MRRRKASGFEDNSGLVPMADMLSNTVGIMLFIMAFTVLQTGGVLISKRLPMERATDSYPIYMVCRNQQLFPLNPDLSDQITDPLDKPTYDTARDWVLKFNHSQAEDDYFVVTGKGEVQFNSGIFENSAHLELIACYKPKNGAGLAIDDLYNKDSKLSRMLTEASGNKRFVYFIVYPDAIDLFRRARDIITDKFGLGSGWGPRAAGKPIQFNLSGVGGLSPHEQ